MGGHTIIEMNSFCIWIIYTGAYPPGGRLPPERELAEKFSVSRPTVREAIIALEAQGFVRIKSGSGIYILPHSEDGKTSNQGTLRDASAFELTEARAILEGEAAALAARMITPEQLTALEQALTELGDEYQNGELLSERADEDFHRIIADATHNPFIDSGRSNRWIIDVQLTADHPEGYLTGEIVLTLSEPIGGGEGKMGTELRARISGLVRP